MRPVLLASAIVLACTACGSATDSAPTASAPAKPSQVAQGTAFTSTQYGYRAMVPEHLLIQPATAPWDGGDIDHTAEYADRFADPESAYLFVLGLPTELDEQSFADDHARWLTENRGCSGPVTRTSTEVDSLPTVRMTFECPEGIFGPTLVDKAVLVDRGRALVFTSMTPDTGNEHDPQLTELLETVHLLPEGTG